MRKPFVLLLMCWIAASGLRFATAARAADYPAAPAPFSNAPAVVFSSAQLDNLVAPVALYPDPLLAQVVVAATFPDQLDEAARFLRAGANARAIDEQPWDVSVKAVAHYPTVLYMMADNLDWTTSVGQAYVAQSTDVMTAVQRLRAQARAAGSLVTTPQMEVVMENGSVALWPVYPGTLYVPVYDPALVYYSHSGYRAGPVIAFSTGFAIGVWLNYDCDWPRHRVYYHGWASRRGWVHRYRPDVHVTNVYVNTRYTQIRVNRSVVNRRVDYRTLNRYNTIHRDVHYDDVRGRRPPARDRQRERGAPGERRDVRNKVIRRNVDPDDPRIESNRGRPLAPRPGRTTSPRAVRPAPEQRQTRPPRDTRPAPRQRQTTPRVEQPPSQQQHGQIQRRQESVFRGGHPGIDPRAARQRGQASRHQAQRATPPAKPSTQRRQAPSRRGGTAPEAESGKERMERR